MARNYANLFTAIWQDPDWRKLSANQQRAYMLLVTQPNISAAGMLPLTLRRWAAMACDTDAAGLRADLMALAATRWIVIDEAAEEVLVRSFVRHDNGYANPRRQPSIRDAGRDIASPVLRRALAAEFDRLGLPTEWLPVDPEDPDDGPDSHSDSHFIAAELPPVDKPVDNKDVQVNSHSDIDGMANRFQTARTTTHNPQPANHNPQPTTTTTAALASRPPDETVDAEIIDNDQPGTDIAMPDQPANAQQILAAWIDYCASNRIRLTKRLKGQYAKHIKTALDENFPPDLIKRALANMLTERVTGHPSYLDNHLVRVQAGPARRERRLTPGEESVMRLTNGGQDAQVIDLMAEILRKDSA